MDGDAGAAACVSFSVKGSGSKKSKKGERGFGLKPKIKEGGA
jgi:hypothetical protein